MQCNRASKRQTPQHIHNTRKRHIRQDAIVLNEEGSGASKLASQKRNYGIDLLRMVSMFMVLVLHVELKSQLLSGGGALNGRFALIWLIELAAYGAVDIFALISGYVGVNSKFKFGNFLQIWLIVVFWSTTEYLVAAVSGLTTFNAPEFLRLFFPLTEGAPWYARCYLILFFFMPFLNTLVKSLSKKQLVSLLTLLFVIFSAFQTVAEELPTPLAGGYNVMWLAILYVGGACLKQLRCQEVTWRRFLPLAICLCTLAMWGLFLLKTWLGAHPEVGFTGISYVLRLGQPSYVSPIAVFASGLMVVWFSGLDLTRAPKMVAVIKLLAPIAFDVYIVHQVYPTWDLLNTWLAWIVSVPTILLPLVVLGLSALIYILATALALLRQRLFGLLRLGKVCQWLGLHLAQLFDGLMVKWADETP